MATEFVYSLNRSDLVLRDDVADALMGGAGHEFIPDPFLALRPAGPVLTRREADRTSPHPTASTAYFPPRAAVDGGTNPFRRM
jgi:hypothetical protein